MAKNKGPDERRYGAVKGRVQFQDPKTGLWSKQNAYTGEIMGTKVTKDDPFKGITKIDKKLGKDELHEMPKKAKK